MADAGIARSHDSLHSGTLTRADLSDIVHRKLGLSRTTVQARIERLEREGVIAGYGVRLSDAYQSDLIRAHVLITIAPKSLAAVTAHLNAIHEVTALYSAAAPERSAPIAFEGAREGCFDR
jgi:DNA-binding Lrp family transcriptional regulator